MNTNFINSTICFFLHKNRIKKKKIPTKYINEIRMKFLCKKFHPKRWMIYIVCLGSMKHPYRFNLGSDIWDQLLSIKRQFHWRERNSFFLAKYSSNLMIAYLKHKFEKKILLIHAFRTEIIIKTSGPSSGKELARSKT